MMCFIGFAVAVASFAIFLVWLLIYGLVRVWAKRSGQPGKNRG
jgi:hypothetical protein